LSFLYLNLSKKVFDPRDQPRKDNIHEKQIKAKKDRGENDNDGCAVNLVP
jgi:hypothetical protein